MAIEWGDEEWNLNDLLLTDSDNGAPAPRGGPAVRVLGEPLPAHTLVLRLASERFKTQVEHWSSEESEEAAGPSTKRRMVAAATGGGEPRAAYNGARRSPLQLRVPLGSEEELPAARAAIKFAYTGHIEAGSICEALQVWRQADYLGMEGCAEACVAAVREKLLVAAGAAAEPPILQLYGCTQLWPNPEQETAFAALLIQAQTQLALHFGDALAVLNQATLFQQLLALPAVGMEALLKSDYFGTDSESSVVLLLAEWLKKHYSSTDVATRWRLCGLLRLACCSRAYLQWVLPALALEHLAHPYLYAGWLPLTPQQVSLIAAHAAAGSELERSSLKDELCDAIRRSQGPGQRRSLPEAWLSRSPRRQCIAVTGLSYSFSVKRESLAEAFCGLETGRSARLFVTFDGAPRAVHVVAMGLWWRACIEYRHGSAHFTCGMGPELPPLYGNGGAASRRNWWYTGSGADWDLRFPVAALGAAMFMHSWQEGGQRFEGQVLAVSAGSALLRMGALTGASHRMLLEDAPVLPLPQTEQTEQQRRRARKAAVLAQWARWLDNSQLRGKLVLLSLPAPAPAGPAAAAAYAAY